MLKHRQSGMTLIEIAVAMAVTGLMAGMVLAGQNQLRTRARFTDAIETAKDDLAKVQNEAVTTVQENGDGRDNNGITFFAKRIRFTNNSGSMDVDTLLFDPVTNTIVPGSKDLHSVGLPFGVKYLTAGSTGEEILYVRWPTNGNLYTFTPPSGFGPNDHDFAAYNPANMTNRAAQDYQFSDPDGHTATLTVNGATDTITKVYH